MILRCVVPRDCTDQRKRQTMNSPLIRKVSHTMNNEHKRKGAKCVECFTPKQRNYLISQTDPFHDDSYSFTAAPSSVDSNSVVLTVNQEEVYTAQSMGLSVTPGAKFDVNIAMFPCSRSQNVFLGNLSQPAAFDQFTRTSGDGRTSGIYPLTLSAAESGLPTFASMGVTGTDATQPPNIFGMSNDALAFYTPGAEQGVSPTNAARYGRRMRLIASSFEVVNESPDIYNSGSVTSYEIPSINEKGHCAIRYLDGTTSRYQDATSNILPMPPVSARAASLMKGSVTWRSSEGTYVIARKSQREIPFSSQNYNSALIIGGPFGTDSTYDGGAWSSVTDSIACTRIYPTDLNCSNSWFPYNIAGAYFSGLSSEYTSLRVRYRTSWEIIPSPDDTDLVPLANPTMPFDSDFEDYLQLVLHKLPIAVKQTENPSGEWWKKVLSTTGKVLQEGSPFLDKFVPGTGAITSNLGSAAIAGSKLIKTKKKKVVPKKK